MIEIADRFRLLDAQSSKNVISEGVCDQWKPMAAFEWRTYEHKTQLYAPLASAARHNIVGSTEFEADLPVDRFSFLNHDLGPNADEMDYSLVGMGSVVEHGQEGVTRGLLYDHSQRSSYLLSWPKTCTFVRDNSLPAMIEDYEAYRWYQITGGGSEYDDGMSRLGLTSYPLPHPAGFPRTSSLYANCNACHNLLATDGICEQCALWGIPLLSAPGANDLEAPYVVARSSTPHIVSMQAYDTKPWPKDLDPEIHYTITEIPPDHALYTALLQDSKLGRDCTGFEGISDWKRECYCASSTRHRQISHAYQVDHTKYDSPHGFSFSTEDERPRNLLV